MNAFPNNLKRLRKAVGLTQDSLAEQLHVTRQTVSGRETGRCQPDIETLAAIAQILNADIHELIYGVKPGSYPKYQHRYVMASAICGGLAAAVLLFWMFAMPWIKLVCNTYYHDWYFRLFHSIPQLGSFFAGMLLPASLALVHPVHLAERGRKYCLIGGVAAVLPGILIGLDMILIQFESYPQFFIQLFFDWIIWSEMRWVLLVVLPFVGGILFFQGLNHD